MAGRGGRGAALLQVRNNVNLAQMDSFVRHSSAERQSLQTRRQTVTKLTCLDLFQATRGSVLELFGDE